MRKQTDGVWGDFKGNSDTGKAALWAKYAKDGQDGSSTYYVTVTAFCDSEDKPDTPTGGSYDFSTGTMTYPTGWQASVDNATYSIWISTAVFNKDGIVGSWTSPMRISNGDNEDNASQSSFTLNQTNPLMALVKTDESVTGNNTDTISVSRAITASDGTMSITSATIQSVSLDSTAIGTGVTASVSGNVITVTATTSAAIGSYNVPFTVRALYAEDGTTTTTLYGTVSVVVIAGTATSGGDDSEQYVIGVSPTNLNLAYIAGSTDGVFSADLDDAISYIVVYKGTTLQSITNSNVSITNNENCTTSLKVTAGTSYSGYIEISSVSTKVITNGAYNSSGDKIDATVPEDTGGYDVTITVDNAKYSAHVAFTTNSTSYSKSLVDNAILYSKSMQSTINSINDDVQTLESNYSNLSQTSTEIKSSVSSLKTQVDTNTNNITAVQEDTSSLKQTASSISADVSSLKTS